MNTHIMNIDIKPPNHTGVKLISLTISNKTHAELIREALSNQGWHIGNYADTLLEKVTIEVSDITANLVGVRVWELGFNQGATFIDNCRQALKFGLELCPAKLVPHLCLRYKPQVNSEWLTIMMRPIKDPTGTPRIFNLVYSDEECYLNAMYCDPEVIFAKNNLLVFVQGKDTSGSK